MTTSKADLRDRLRQQYGRPELAREAVETPVLITPAVELERAFVLDGDHRTVITAPIREVAQGGNGSFTYLTGRLVGADEPNRNNSMWSTEDLQLGEGTVAGGPLNWLHDDTHIIGCLLDGNLIAGREAADAGVQNHIRSNAAVWSFLYPRETQVIERAAVNGELFYSMECISKEVACVDTPDRPGCDAVVSYFDYDARSPKCCSHLRERSAVRRFVDPLFQGAAVIVPPVRPGWANASAEVARQAASAAEHGMTGVDEAIARDLAAVILGWANR